MKEYLVESQILKQKININRFINNSTLKNLTEPVMLVFGYVNEKNKDLYQSGNAKAVEQYKNDNGEQVAQTLRDAQYRAAFYTEKRASRPNYIAVTETGIMTPFYQPDEAPQIARDILETLVRANVALPLSFVWGTTFDQLAYPAPRDKQNFRSVLAGNLAHPNPKRFDEIMQQHGKDFYKKMLDEAFNNKVARADIYKKYESLNRAYHGGITSLPFIILAKKNLEPRHFVYGSPGFDQAYKYAIIDNESRGKDFNYEHAFGFLHVYKSTGNVLILSTSSLETGGSPRLPKNINDMEFPLGKSNVEYVETLICFKEGAFLIPKDDDNWKDFKELSEVSYYDERERMLFRRENLIMQQALNHNAVVTYSPRGRMQTKSIDDKVKNYASDVRKKLVNKIDNTLGTKLEDIKAPKFLENIEQKASILRFKALNEKNTK